MGNSVRIYAAITGGGKYPAIFKRCPEVKGAILQVFQDAGMIAVRPEDVTTSVTWTWFVETTWNSRQEFEQAVLALALVLPDLTVTHDITVALDWRA